MKLLISLLLAAAALAQDKPADKPDTNETFRRLAIAQKTYERVKAKLDAELAARLAADPSNQVLYNAMVAAKVACDAEKKDVNFEELRCEEPKKP